jgi:hypothetical protein
VWTPSSRSHPSRRSRDLSHCPTAPYSCKVSRTVTARWQHSVNRSRPHSSLRNPPR